MVILAAGHERKCVCKSACLCVYPRTICIFVVSINHLVSITENHVSLCESIFMFFMHVCVSVRERKNPYSLYL